jgi:hypothetical protein
MRTESLIPLALPLALALPLTADADGITDYRSKKPPSITLPAAGKSYIDPVFGTKIIRVTDSNHGTRCFHAYSYWPAFNRNNTRLLLSCDDRGLLYRFDPSTDKVTPDGTLTGSTGYPVKWEGAVWSQYYNDTIYALDKTGTRLWRINVGKRGASGYHLLKDFSGTLGSVTLDHLTVSDDAKTYAFYTRSASTGERRNAVVWDRSTDTTYVLPRSSTYDLDEVKIDKAGKRLMVNYDDDTMLLWTFRTGKKVWFKPGVKDDNAGGHYDIGRYFIANSNQFKAGMALRTFSVLKPAEDVVRYLRPDGTQNWSIADHVSLRTTYEEFFVGSTYAGDGTWAAFEKEIYLGYTDGHGFVRLAHTRSKGEQTSSQWRYRAQPRAVVDRHGRYIVYTSDLGSSKRMDVMILKIPSSLRES